MHTLEVTTINVHQACTILGERLLEDTATENETLVSLHFCIRRMTYGTAVFLDTRVSVYYNVRGPFQTWEITRHGSTQYTQHQQATTDCLLSFSFPFVWISSACCKTWLNKFHCKYHGQASAEIYACKKLLYRILVRTPNRAARCKHTGFVAAFAENLKGPWNASEKASLAAAIVASQCSDFRAPCATDVTLMCHYYHLLKNVICDLRSKPKKKESKKRYHITFYSHFNYHLIITQPRMRKVLYLWEQCINMTRVPQCAWERRSALRHPINTTHMT